MINTENLKKIVKKYLLIECKYDEDFDYIWSITVGFWLMFMCEDSNKMTIMEAVNSGWWQEDYRKQEKFVREMLNIGFAVVISDDSVKKYQKSDEYNKMGKPYKIADIDFIVI